MLLSVGGVIVLIALLFFFVFFRSDKLVCKSKEGNITIMYNKRGINGYSAVNMKYNLSEQKNYAKQVGIDEYIKEFNYWFETNTSGSCLNNGKKVDDYIQTTKRIETTTKRTNYTTYEDTKVVGDSNYGYISIPKNWGKFF